MISSEPADKVFLDHDYLEDVDGRLYVVIGNSHPSNYVIAYVKYVPTNERTPWRKGSRYYARVIRMYGVKNVIPTVKVIQEFTRDAMLNVNVPILRLSRLKKHYIPRYRLQEIIKRPNDALEVKLLEAIDRLRTCCNISLSNLGVTGSLLPMIHNVKISDIDVIVYGCREAIELCECVSECFDKVPKDVMRRRLISRAKAYGLSVNDIIKLNAPYRMLYLNGKEINFCLVDDKPNRYCEFVYVPLSKATIKLELIGNCKSLFYPSIAYVSKVIEVIKSRINEEVIKRELKYVISYESIYSYVMFRGGKFIVEGVIERVLPYGHLALLIGASEYPGYLIPSS